MVPRAERVNQLIKKEISLALEREGDFPPGVLVTLTRVDTSGNLIQAKVFISVFPESEFPYALKTLAKERGYIQQSLNRKLRIKPLPHLEFRNDFTEREADKIEKILKEI